MNRIGKFALAGLFVLTTSVAAQTQGQPGQPRQGGTQQGGTQQGGTQQVGRQPGTTQQGGNFGGMNQTPWFGNQDIRQNLKLNNDQFNQLNRAYSNAWNRYQQGITALDSNLTDQQRQQRMQAMQQEFGKNFSTAANDIFTSPEQRQRFEQLGMQFRGFGAFSDPMVQQKLNLTAEQRQKLNQLNQDWQRQMDTLNQKFQTDPKAVTTQFNDMRKQFDTRLNSVLSQEQQQSWRQMTGDPFNFQPNAFFQNSSSGNSGNSGTPK